MTHPLTLASLCADLYDTDRRPAAFDNVWEFEDTHAAHRKLEDGSDVLVFRGSADVSDWLHDLAALPLWDERLGFVHAGFMAGMNDILAAASLVIGANVVVTGHSLGGARARLMAGLLAVNKRPAVQCCVFGSPRPAFVNLGRVLAKSGTPMASYRNRNDPVPLVPSAWLPVLGDPWAHPDRWTRLDSAPSAVELDPLRDHSMARYLEGLKRLLGPVPGQAGESGAPA